MTTKQYAKMFGADKARITRPCGTMFLILGWWRTSDGEWFKNGEPICFRYLEEKVVASGTTPRRLLESAKKYKRLCKRPSQKIGVIA